MDSKETITIELYANGSLSKQYWKKNYDLCSVIYLKQMKSEGIHYTISEVE